MRNQSINPDDLFDSVQYGFSQLVRTSGTTTVYLSGQVAWTPDETIIGTDLGTQTDAALRNVARALAAADAQLRDVVMLRIYFVERRRAELNQISAALRRFFPHNPPAATWIGVQSLADEAFLVEIEAVAVLP